MGQEPHESYKYIYIYTYIYIKKYACMGRNLKLKRT